MTKLYKFLQKGRIPKFIVGFVAIFVLGSLISFGVERTNRLIIDLRPVSYYFDYEGIEYVDVEEEEALVFVSTSIVKKKYPMFWNDVLQCSNGETFTFFSSQNTASEQPEIRSEYRRMLWNYNEPFPRGKTCILFSTIVMHVDGITKRQTVQTNEFKINDIMEE